MLQWHSYDPQQEPNKDVPPPHSIRCFPYFISLFLSTLSFPPPCFPLHPLQPLLCPPQSHSISAVFGVSVWCEGEKDLQSDLTQWCHSNPQCIPPCVRWLYWMSVDRCTTAHTNTHTVRHLHTLTHACTVTSLMHLYTYATRLYVSCDVWNVMYGG